MNELTQACMNCLIHGADLHELVEIAARYFACPIILCDNNRLPIAYSHDYPESCLIDHMNMRNQVYMNEHESIEEYMHIIQKQLYSDKPWIFSYKYVRNRYYCCGCLYQNKALGNLSIPDLEDTIQNINEEEFVYVSQIFGLALALNHCPYKQKDIFNHELLWGLLNSIYPQSFIQDRILWNAFDGIKQYQILWCVSKSGDELPETIAAFDQMNHFWSVAFEGGTVILMDGSDTELQRQLHHAALKASLLISTSRCFSDLRQLKQQLQLAQKVYHYALKADQQAGVAKYNDYKVYYLLDCVKQHIPVDEVKTDVLNEIDQYDAENQSEYGITIRTYILNSCDIQATADKLCVHKNTVNYRIKRIHELFHVDFSEITQISTLYYSILLEE